MLSEINSAGMSIRFAVLTGLVAAMFGLSALPIRAADYPTRNITLVVPSPPGGGMDTQARILAPKLSELLGQNVVSENRAGASGNIGAQAVAKAALMGMAQIILMNAYLFVRTSNVVGEGDAA